MKNLCLYMMTQAQNTRQRYQSEGERAAPQLKQGRLAVKDHNGDWFPFACFCEHT